MKRYLCYFICFLFLFIPKVRALNGVCMIGSSYSDVKQNDEITINFYIHDIDNLQINGGYLELKYDNYVFDFIRVENVHNRFNVNVSNQDGLLKLNLNSNSYISDINDNTILASVRFRVKDDSVNGSNPISMVGGSSSFVTDTSGEHNSCLVVGNKNLYFNVYNTNNEALLSSLTLNYGNLNHDFSNNVTNYNVSVDNDVDSVSVNSTCSIDGCSIDGNGSRDLKVGKNVIKLVVTSPNGRVTKTYTIIVNRDVDRSKEEKKEEIVKDNNALLKTLSISEGVLNPVFSPTKLEYEIEVDSNISKIRINAICAGIECTVKGTGNKYLKYGENVYEIEVVAEDGTNNFYIIKIFRKYELRLNNLNVETYKLSPKFDEDIYNYKVFVKKDVDKLNITPQSIDPNAIIKIIGNNNFVDGDNVVKVEITYDGTDKKVYTIVVNKESNDKNKTGNSKDIWDNTYVIIGGIVAGIVLFVLMIGIIWFLLRDKKEKENN